MAVSCVSVSYGVKMFLVLFRVCCPYVSVVSCFVVGSGGVGDDVGVGFVGCCGGGAVSFALAAETCDEVVVPVLYTGMNVQNSYLLQIQICILTLAAGMSQLGGS